MSARWNVPRLGLNNGRQFLTRKPIRTHATEYQRRKGVCVLFVMLCVTYCTHPCCSREEGEVEAQIVGGEARFSEVLALAPCVCMFSRVSNRSVNRRSSFKRCSPCTRPGPLPGTQTRGSRPFPASFDQQEDACSVSSVSAPSGVGLRAADGPPDPRPGSGADDGRAQQGAALPPEAPDGACDT